MTQPSVSPARADKRIPIAILAALAVAVVIAIDLHDGHLLRAARDFTLGLVFIAAALYRRAA